jgi:uncharacterized protein (TIGR03790 family)
MRLRTPLAALALFSAAAAAAPPPARAGNDPSGVVVLVNTDSPDSIDIAAHYAARRCLAPRQVVRLRVPVKPELTLEEYRAAVEEPLRAHLSREGLEERARCIVLTRGIPVRVRFDGGGYVSTAALLAAMDLPIAGTTQGGSIPGAPGDHLRPEERANPYRTGPFPEDRRPGGTALRLVTALDGWSAADAEALVDRSVAADGGPPADPLFVFQDANGGAQGRNSDYPGGEEVLRTKGFRVEAVPAGAGAVKGRSSLMGWMSGGAYSAIDDEGARSNRFAAGAIVDMLESFGAVPQNFDEKAGRSQLPVAVMVHAGASGVHGTVAEPYSHTFPDALLFDRYASGLDLAESFHASLPYLYWMNLVLGDPLCAPFARRPVVTVEGLPARATGRGPIRVRLKALAAPGGEAPVSMELFADGVLLADLKGTEGEVSILPESLADGDRVVLAVARCEGPNRARGWTARTLAVDIAIPRIVRWDPAAGAAGAPPAGPFGAEWSGREPPRSPSLALFDGAGKPVEGTSAADPARHRLSFAPRAPLDRGRTYELRASGFPDLAPSARFTAGAAALTVAGPAEAVAGEPFVLRVGAGGDGGAPGDPLAGERIEVRLSDPPVLAALLDLPAGRSGPAEIPVRIRRAGATEVRVLARRSGAAGTLPLVVRPGPAASLSLLIASNTPVGEPFDVAVQVRDALGNPVPDWTGTVVLAAPEDPAAALPGPVELRTADRGRAVFRGVVFGTPGHQWIVASAPGGLEGKDDTLAEATTIRRWLAAGPFEGGGRDPFAETAVPGSDAGRRPAEGAVLGDRPWRSCVSGRPLVDPGKGKGVLVAVAYLRFPAETEAVLHLGHGGRLRAWFAGKPVYEGAAAPKSAEDRGTAALKVPAGPAALVLRLEVRGEEDGFAARFSTPDGKPIPGLLVLAARPFPPSTLSIAGTIRDAKGPVAGAEVRLSGPTGFRTKTGAEGWYGFPDLRPGSWRVTPSVKGRKCDPESRPVELKDAEATAVDFTVR